ncbi:neutral alpha-glucosidase C isoform X2 [Esox lucius]|uniref:neutral alpha-glucosidase C isoform X2 n=1 Tax=Esox lucius TaxID=8010 RepID=UPI0014775C61|nr:neutral alpha-glucosidase C isoform X2 [Esox lucius]
MEMAEETIVSLVPDDEGKQKFRKCDQISFYRRQTLGPNLQYRACLDTLVLTERGARVELEPDCGVRLILSLSASDETVRVQIDELQPIRTRYSVPDVLTKEPVGEPLRVAKETRDLVSLTWGEKQYQVRVWACPFRLEVLCGEEAMVTFNSRDKLHFDTLQDRPSAEPGQRQQDDSSLWQETWREFVDIKANGPSSVGADLCLHGYNHVYGLPEHADSLKLSDTSRLGLYGSVPLVLAHKTNQSIGVFWLNTSETLVDVQYNPQETEEEGTPPMKRRRVPPQTDLRWLSESGLIDCMVLLGPSPSQVMSQYAQLTGYQALPPLFSLGYHQCRWNYEDEADVKAVDAGFDHHNIPYDVIWLDIEHTDGKRYFTWDPVCFPDPVSLQRHLEDRKRKLVVINDPHIKVDPDWSLYCEARDGGHFVKDREGQIYQGSCWPGDSNYLDFSSPATRAWYSQRFALERYSGSTSSLFVWNDMNEPSVFGGPEQTMPKDAMHHGGWEHRELHNLYGFHQHMATVQGLITRSGGLERPFALSRSFFAGSQRLGAVWTGDNVASWDYLKISIPMILSLSLAGISFCGADVGGFVKDPDPELLVRWYQAGALTPFFRGHAAMNTKRREPWLFGDQVTSAIRCVIQQRYLLLPYWYTLFHQAHTAGLPPLRPLWVEFPADQDTFTVDHQYMIGGALMACPVTEPGATEVKVLLPGSEVWYDIQSTKLFRGNRGLLPLPVTLDTVPVFQRGGTVVSRRTGCGSCTADLQKHPLSLTVALDSQGGAEGELYLDDGHSFRYRDRREFILRRFSLRSDRLICRCANPEGRYQSDDVVQSVTILGTRRRPANATLQQPGYQDVPVKFLFDEARHMLTLEDLNVGLGKDWDIKIL